ncbi:MAG TPA: hypothetical protein PK395_22010 [bacterium]|nr:hypothetical protein [bacterium]
MKGVEFVIGEDGTKKAVQINLHTHRSLWEDFYDTVRAKERADEPRETLEEVKSKVLNRT